MKKLTLALALLLGLAGPALPQSPVVPSTSSSIQIAGTIATSTKIITGDSTKQIYVTGLVLVPVATSVVTFTFGSGSNCGTGTTSITGAMIFAAGQTINYGTGNGALFVVPLGKDLCITIATAAAPGSLAFAQF